MARIPPLSAYARTIDRLRVSPVSGRNERTSLGPGILIKVAKDRSQWGGRGEVAAALLGTSSVRELLREKREREDAEGVDPPGRGGGAAGSGGMLRAPHEAKFYVRAGGT